MRHLLIVALFFPAVSLAAEIQAGFPSEAIWISKTSAVEGETLVISAVVYNGDAASLHGTIVFTADGTRICAREFELSADGSQIHSVEWRPKAGEYRVAAVIEGTSMQVSQRETSSILVSIDEPPPPSAMRQAVQTAGSIASSSLPAVLGIATSVFETIEPYRKKGVERLESYIEKTRSRKNGNVSGTIAGTSTSNVNGFRTPASENKNFVSAIAQTAAAVALFVMSALYLFYPLLALLFLGTFYLLARRIRRRPE